jgi:hypothetical protein
MFPFFQKFSIEAEGDFIPVDGIGIQRHGMCRSLFVWTVITPHRERVSRDHHHCRAVQALPLAYRRHIRLYLECCGSAAPRQMPPMITLISVHRIVCYIRMALSIAGQCI